MSGLPWFELDVDMPGDPKCRALGARLKNREAFAFVVRLYAYCYRHATAAFSDEGGEQTIEDACEWRGRPGVLFAALVETGFLDPEPGRVTVHGVADRLAPHAKKLERDRARQRERRADVAATIGRRTPDVSGDSDSDKDRDRSHRAAAPINGDWPHLTRLAAAASKRWECSQPVKLPAARDRDAMEAAVQAIGIDAAMEALHADVIEAFKSRRLDDAPETLGWGRDLLLRLASERRASA